MNHYEEAVYACTMLDEGVLQYGTEKELLQALHAVEKVAKELNKLLEKVGA